MAPPFSLHCSPKKAKKFMAVYLVRSFRTYARIRSLTTGTFNRVVKDRIAFRLSGAPSGLDGLTFFGRTRFGANPSRVNPAVLETFQPYRPRETLSIRTSHSISTCFPHVEARLGMAAGEPLAHQSIAIPNRAERPMRKLHFGGGSGARNDMAFRFNGAKFGARRSGRQKIEKRSYWRSLL